MVKISSFRESGRRYSPLRIIGAFWIVLGTIMMVMGGLAFAVIGYFAIAARDAPTGPSPSVATGIYALWSFGLVISGLQLIAMGDVCRLLIHMEENTRASAQALERIRDRLEGNPAEVAPNFRS